MLKTLITRENITLLLSIIGSIGTLITVITAITTHRKNLKVKIIKSVYDSDLRRLILNVTFENRSRLPIAVTEAKLSINKKTLDSLPYPFCIEKYSYREGKEVINRIFTYNLQFPSDIQQLSASSGYILFEFSQEYLENQSTPLILLISSTRGGVQKIELPYTKITML